MSIEERTISVITAPHFRSLIEFVDRLLAPDINSGPIMRFPLHYWLTRFTRTF